MEPSLVESLVLKPWLMTRSLARSFFALLRLALAKVSLVLKTAILSLSLSLCVTWAASARIQRTKEPLHSRRFFSSRAT